MKAKPVRYSFLNGRQSFLAPNRRTVQAAVTLAAGFLTWQAAANDPQIDSWLTRQSGRYARIFPNAASQSAGDAVTTWSNGSQSQNLPAYSGVQEVDSSSDWVYLRTTGLGLHTLGPWSAGFPNLPLNRKVLYRIPRLPTTPAAKSLTGNGPIGYFIDGVAMFDSRDAFSWNGSTETQGAGSWNREAYVNEGATFDPANAHQDNSGTYHYHANPIALRYLLGDHVTFNPTTETYSESTAAVTAHSPILGWVRDGYPIYGPYGYSDPRNPASGVRRMLSGYQRRNGERGTDNLTLTGRTALPAWATRLYGASALQTGPAVSAAYPLGRYMEDNAFLGDLGYQQGIDFDLDEFNGRFCVTPEFPNGTYAYFVSIEADGTPQFPYNIGRAFYGTATGGAVTALSETVATNYLGGAESELKMQAPSLARSTITLVWSAVEGGSYQMESSSDLSSWTTNASGIAAVENRGRYSGQASGHADVFRVTRTSLAAYDPVTGTAGSGMTGGTPTGPALARITPASGSRGASLLLTMILGGMAPPVNLNPTSASIGTIAGTALQRIGTQVTAQFMIPSDALIGPATVQVVFPGPDGAADVTFTLENGFTID
jgi:hypothetical protein